jgi:hypothetical protein
VVAVHVARLISKSKSAEDCDASVLSGPAATLPDVTEGTPREGEWPDTQWYVILPVAYLPAVKAGSLERMESNRNPACMRDGIPAPVRIGRQLIPRPPRQCCSYHSIDWHLASAAAVSIARRVPAAAERMPGYLFPPRQGGPGSAEFQKWEEEQDREFEPWQGPQDQAERLLAASNLADREREAAASLLDPEDGIILTHCGSDRRLHYTGGMHRAHALLSAGVRWTVVLRTLCCSPDRDCSPAYCSIPVRQPTRPTAKEIVSGYSPGQSAYR